MTTLSSIVEWAINNSESLRNLGLFLAAILGLPLLIWRTYAANKSADALATSSQAALENSKSAIAQSQAAVKQSEVAVKQAELSAENATFYVSHKITEIIAHAFDQLASNVPAVKMGAIKILERISEDSPRDYYSIMDVLSAFVRHHANWPVDAQVKERSSEMTSTLTSPELQSFFETKPDYLHTKFELSPEIQTALTVLGRRQHPGKFIDLKNTDLHGAKLNGLDLSGAALSYSNFTGARLIGTNLSKAMLLCTIFDGALMQDARLEKVKAVACSFRRTVLKNAYFSNADLSFVEFNDADIHGVDFRGADLSEAKGITQSQLKNVRLDEFTKLPAYLKSM